MKRWLSVLFILSLCVLIIVPACGGEKDDVTQSPTPIPTQTSTPTNATTSTITATNTPKATPSATADPVKLGAINSWSGPAAMSGLAFADPCIKLVQQQVKDQGGILGGRQLEVIRYDNRGSVAEAQAGVKKLVEEEKVSAIVFGGASTTEQMAVINAAEQYKILVSSLGASADYSGKYAVSNGTSKYPIEQAIYNSAIKVEKAKSVAFLSSDLKDSRGRITDMKSSFGAAGVEVVYEDYAPTDTLDFSPYLTKIKYEKPDYLYIDFASSEPYITVAKQIMELGGWGNIKVGGLPSAESAIKQAGAAGWYIALYWFPGSEYPGSVKFETGLKAILGRMPSASHVYFYMCLWTAINSIELAGTDSDVEKIAQAARSGNLQWETPAGLSHWKGDVWPDLSYQLARVESGKLVRVTVPE